MTIHPKQMTDKEIRAKHADCMKRLGRPAVILPPTLYAHAEARGHDMSDYVINKPMPIVHKPGALSARKHLSNRYCGGNTCMPGKNGVCVACSEDD